MYRNFILQSLLIYLSTCDVLGRGGIAEIAVSPLREWRENIIQEKLDFTFFMKGYVFYDIKGKLELSYTYALCEGFCVCYSEEVSR